MSLVKEGLYYTNDHEWVEVNGDIAVIGITDYAQGELGDIVFFDLKQAGITLNEGDSVGTVEAVKAVSDIFSPVSGELLELNESVINAPDTANSDPYGEGWIAKVKMSNPEEISKLLSAGDYIKSFLASEENSMPYIPNSPETLFEMVRAMGYSSFDELYDKAVPKRARFEGCLGLPKPLSEMEVFNLLSGLARKNSDSNSTDQFHRCRCLRSLYPFCC
jgi:glycine cleavage system H protein